ncbi:MAG: apolipoprotein N-acyltransferase [Lacipirellulaceae bacterium]
MSASDSSTPANATLRVALVGSVLLFLAQPPVGWWPLAWVAPVAWLLVAQREVPLTRGDYLRLWLAGWGYWMLTLHWLRLPHPLTAVGWPLLCAYLGCYLPAFVAITRVMTGKVPSPVPWKTPLSLGAPVVWTGLEFLQAHLFTGFLMGGVSHSQWEQGWLVGIARRVGAYGVSFALLVFASLVTELVVRKLMQGGVKKPVWPLAVVSVALVTVILESTANYLGKDSNVANLRVALIQGNTLATWDPDPNRSQRIMDRQTKLSIEAVERALSNGKPIELVIWPESMFRPSIVTYDDAFDPPPDADDAAAGSTANTRLWLESLGQKLDAHLLLGADRFDVQSPSTSGARTTERYYNSAVLVDRSGKLLSAYDKTHLVPFGEYIPFADGMPALYYLTPISGGMGAGAGPVAMEVPRADGEAVRVAPSICYETVVPHVIRRHVAELTRRGQAPHLLVNVTNDAWFWGSSELDLHLACGVFRAVETGTPLVVAANGGLSAVIATTGEVLAVSPRMEEHTLVADAPLRTAIAPTPYVRWGDWFAATCFSLAFTAAAFRLIGRIAADER